MSFQDKNFELLGNLTNESLALMAQEAVYEMPDYINLTPVSLWTETHARTAGREFYVKDETSQPSGTFKDRGASFAVGQYVEKGQKSFVTPSGGSHAKGVARAAKHHAVDSVVVLPKNTDQSVKDVIKSLDSTLVEHGKDFTEAEEFADDFARTYRARTVHPFADPFVMAGQGSIGVELLEQVPDMDFLVLPVGGGGLLAGVGSVVKRHSPKTQVVAAQVNGCTAFFNSATWPDPNGPRALKSVDTRFGGLAVRKLNPDTYRLGKSVTDHAMAVCPESVFKTLSDYYRTTGQKLQPAAAVGLTACRNLAFYVEKDAKIVTVATGDLTKECKRV